MMNIDAEHHTELFNHDSRWFKALLIFMFLLAALIRRDDIKAPGLLIEREYNSAIFARAFYFENNDSIEPWRQDNAMATRAQFPLLEPPVTEYLLSIIYRIVGQEEIWYGRYITSAFWLIGGIFLYKTTRKLISTDSAVFATAYYLFVPWGILISRSVQPDSLMMMMFMISLYLIVRYFDHPGWHSLLMAGVSTGLTLFFRPLVIFALFCTFIALSIHHKGFKHFIDRKFAIFFLLSLTFPIAFFGFRILIGGFLQNWDTFYFRPHLLFRVKFWQSWLELGVPVAGLSALTASFIGFLSFRKTIFRILVIGLLIGYLIFGIVFPYHINTHPYYHIQLFPIIAICASVFLVQVFATLKSQIGRSWWAPALSIFLFVLYFNHKEVKDSLYNYTFENPSLAAEIGEIIHHSPRTVFVAYHYGMPLEYYGEFAGAPWPVKIDDPFYRSPGEKERSVKTRLDSIGFVPEYFVITNFSRYNGKHQDLQEYLEKNCALYEKQEKYLIYNACNPIDRSDT